MTPDEDAAVPAAAAPPHSQPKPPTPPTPPKQPKQPKRRGPLAYAFGLLLAGLLCVLAALACLASWVCFSQTGGAWALDQLPGVQASGLRGALADEAWTLRQLRVSLPSGELRLDGVQWRNPHWQGPQSLDGPWLSLHLGALHAEQVSWRQRVKPKSAPKDETPPSLPQSLNWPIHLRIDTLSAGQFSLDGQPLLQDLSTQLELGAKVATNGNAAKAGSASSALTQHRLSGLRLRTDRLQAQAELSLGADAPFLLSAQTRLNSLPSAARAWQAQLQVTGPLRQLDVQAQLSSPALQTGEAAPAAQLQASLSTLAPWPLTRLRLHTRALDLHALHSAAPHTRLSGEALLDTPSKTTLARLELNLSNAQAGPWDAALLPLRQLRARLGVTPDQPERWLLSELRLDWGATPQAGGRVEVQGSYQARGASAKALSGQVQLGSQFSHWRPAALDSRLPAMTLNGQLNLQASQLPPPSAWWATTAGAARPDLSHWLAQLKLQLNGSLDGHSAHPPPVQLTLDGQFSPQQLLLRELRAQAGSAQAQAQGEWRLQAGQHSLRASLSTQELDPAVWLPGPADAPWRQGRNRLNVQLTGHASLPEASLAPALASEPGLPPLEHWLKQVQGQLSAQLAPSVLSDVPVQGQLQLESENGVQNAQVQLDVAGNLLHLSGEHPPSSARPWQLSLQADHLPELAPLLAWWPEQRAWLQAYWPSAAKLHAQAQLDSLSASANWAGQAHVRDWQATQLQLQTLDLQAHSAPAQASTVDAKLNLNGLTLQGASISQAELRVLGNPAQHQIWGELQAPLRPPAWLEPWLASRPMTGTRARLNLQGQWASHSAHSGDELADEAAGGRWQAHITDLTLGALNDPDAPDWLHTADVQVQLDADAQGTVQALTLAPGRLSLPNTGLRWSQAHWSADPQGGPDAHIEFQAELEPLTVAPVLARLQPEMGWSGDLRMGASLLYRHAGSTQVDIVLERREGDLSVSDPGQVLSGMKQLPLGLSDLRLGIAAQDGRWYFTQALAGQQLGSIVAGLSVQSRPELLWPQPQDALSGVAQLQVDTLGAWGAWVPAGWRLAGKLDAQAQFGGTLANPKVTGYMLGEQLGLRHVLQGIHVHDGRLKVQFEGENARIEEGVFQAGPGTLTLSGQARLGQKPEASLNLVAQKFQLLGRVDRKLITTGQAQLSWLDQALDVKGQLKVDEGLFDFSKGNAPSLDDDVLVLEDLPAAPQASVGSNGSRGPVRTNPPPRMLLALDLGEQLELRGHGLATQLRGQLKLSTTAEGKPQLLGQVRAENGTYAAYGQKLEIDRGLVTFTGPAEDPRLDIFAIRSGLDAKVGVTVTGTALNPRVRLASDTDMTDTERLSWLLLGRASEGLGQADTELLQRAALALLMGEGEGPTDVLLHNLGLTDLSLRQETDGDVRATVVSVGKQLSRRWYVGYERSVNATTGTWQLIYRAAQRVTVRLQSGEQRALDLIWTWRWN